jgi:hypothetical protein
MKKIYFLLFALLITSVSFGQGSESFANSNATTSYADNSFVGDGGVTWSYIASRNANNDANASGISLPALMLRRNSSGSKVTSSIVTGGVGDFSVKLYKGFTGANNRQVDLYVNNTYVATSEAFDDFSEHIFSVTGVNVGGDVVIELRNTTEGQIIVDDIIWTGFAGAGDPGLSIASPTDMSELPSGTTNVDISVATQNFVVGNPGTGIDGHIHWTINGNAQPMKYDTNTESIAVVDGETYVVFMQLVDNSHVPLDPAINQTVTFVVNNPPQALPLYEGFDYAVGADLTMQPNWTNFNGDTNQIDVVDDNLTYPNIEASTGKAVHVEGGNYDITLAFEPIAVGTAYASFIFKITDQSNITDLTDGGYFIAFGGFDARLWVHPDTDPVGSTFDIALTNGSSGSNFTTTKYNVGENLFVVISYDIASGDIKGWINPLPADLGGSAPAALLTDVDATPSTSIGEFILRQDSTGETPSIVFDELRIGTSWAEVTPNTLSVSQSDLNSFSVYPNPVSTGFVNITSANAGNMTISVFDVLGKQVINQTVSNNRLNVSTLNSGVYIMKISQNGTSSTKKLVIK